MPLHRPLFPTGIASLANYQPFLDEYAVLLVVLIVVALMTIHKFAFLKAVFSSGEPSPAESKINCSSCGARNTADSKICDYWDEPLPGQALEDE